MDCSMCKAEIPQARLSALHSGRYGGVAREPSEPASA